MKLKRIHRIENYVNRNQTVSLSELSEEFDVSLNTIRRDINYLAKSGAVKKVYGGVTTTQGEELTTFDFRNTKNSEAKNKIAKEAAKQIENGDLIFIDSGTTTTPIIQHLDTDIQCTILTNNLDVIIEAAKHENLELVVLGNRYYHSTRSFLNDNVQEDVFEYYNISKAFMAATGLSIKNGLTNSDFHEYSLKSAIVEQATHTHILVDSTKIGNSALLTYAELNDIDTIITDKAPTKELREYTNLNNISVIEAE